MGSSWLLHKIAPLGISIDAQFLLAPSDTAAGDGDAGTSFLSLLPSLGWMKLEGRWQLSPLYPGLCASHHAVSLI